MISSKMMRQFRYTNFFDQNDPQQEIEIREGRSLTKVLTGRDRDNGQLIMPKDEFEEFILPQLPPDMKNAVEHGERVPIKVKPDLYISIMEEEEEEVASVVEVTLWRNASNSYVLTKGWKNSFVKLQSLKVGDTVGLRWGHAEAALLFSVISRA